MLFHGPITSTARDLPCAIPSSHAVVVAYLARMPPQNRFPDAGKTLYVDHSVGDNEMIFLVKTKNPLGV